MTPSEARIRLMKGMLGGSPSPEELLRGLVELREIIRLEHLSAVTGQPADTKRPRIRGLRSPSAAGMERAVKILFDRDQAIADGRSHMEPNEVRTVSDFAKARGFNVSEEVHRLCEISRALHNARRWCWGIGVVSTVAALASVVFGSHSQPLLGEVLGDLTIVAFPLTLVLGWRRFLARDLEFAVYLAASHVDTHTYAAVNAALYVEEWAEVVQALESESVPQ